MSLYRTATGFGVDFRDEFGRRHRKFVGLEEAAKRLDAELRGEATTQRRAIRNLTSSPLTISQAADLYRARANVSNQTRERWRISFQHFARFAGEIPVSQVTPRLLEQFQFGTKQRLSQNTWSTEAYALRSLFRFLTDEGYVASNPALTLDVRTIRSERSKAVTLEEENRLLHHATQRVRLRLLLAVDAGLRRGEVVALRANHISREDRTITVHSTKTHSTRIVPMTARLERELEAWRNSTPAQMPDARICSTASGRSLSQNSASDFMRSLCLRAKVQCRFHDLRHTFATRIAAAEPNIFIVSSLLGHVIRSSTAAYVHVSLEMKRDAISKMERQRELDAAARNLRDVFDIPTRESQ